MTTTNPFPTSLPPPWCRGATTMSSCSVVASGLLRFLANYLWWDCKICNYSCSSWLVPRFEPAIRSLMINIRIPVLLNRSSFRAAWFAGANASLGTKRSASLKRIFKCWKPSSKMLWHPELEECHPWVLFDSNLASNRHSPTCLPLLGVLVRVCPTRSAPWCTRRSGLTWEARALEEAKNDWIAVHQFRLFLYIYILIWLV